MSRRPRRSAIYRRSISAILLVALAIPAAAGVTRAATPVTVGYRDFLVGGGVNRATADKPQSKLWFADGKWYGGLFSATSDAYRIHRFNTSTNDWATGAGLPVIDVRNASRGDYLFADNTLWVASAHPTSTTAPYPDDSIKVFKYTFDAAADTYAAAGIASIPGTQTTSAALQGGAATVTIARDTTGRLWTVWPKGGEVRYSTLADGPSETWSPPAQLPGQVGNPIEIGDSSTSDVPAVVSFGSSVGILWSDHSQPPPGTTNGFYFTSIAAGADPAIGANWATVSKLPSIAGGNDGERADNHVNVKVAADGTLYAVTKTGKDTAGCSTNKDRPLITLFRRTPDGTWTVHLVGTVGDCNTRPQVVLSDQLGVVYVVLTTPNGGGAIYLKSAPMTGPEALKFRTADTTIQPGVPFIKSATETNIDDPTTTKQNVTSASGILVLANNLTAARRYYLHNRLTIGGATDTTAPVGAVTIAGGAASTTVPDRVVSVAVPATDTGSGVSQVRIANVGTTTAGVLSGAGATTFAYATPRNWTLTAGDGLKTVYVQWRDGAGNWSTVSNDTIIYNGVALVGSASIDAGAAFAKSTSVSVDVTASDAGSGVANVRMANSGSVDAAGVLNGAGATTSSYSTPKPWTLGSANGTKTVYVQWKDGLGIWSAVKSDTIVLDTVRPTGTLSINDGAAATGNATVGLAIPATDATSGVSQVRIANVGTTDSGGVLNGSGATTFGYAASKNWTLLSGDGTKTVYAQWKDAAGNWSLVVSDSIILDSSLPPFTDIDGSTFYDDIKWLAASGITYGCTATLFCPNDPVTRGQMAAFLHRALPDLPLVRTPTEFTDDDGLTFEPDIEWLSATGITYGCTPTRFCPSTPITRGQMAAFLHRALPDLPLVRTPTEFTDDDGSTFEPDIEWLSATGITTGCSATTFCPTESVTRGQMAAFLHRALGD